jgi:hypothetical protein
MWEALLMLRLMMSAVPLGLARKTDRWAPSTFPVETLKGSIRLVYAAYRLSLPVARTAETGKNNDHKKIA